jgi:peptidoglycan/LPS O-acetylase OafA/YrhL
MPVDGFRHAVDDREVSKMQAKRLIALILGILMMLAMVGCYGAPLSTREKGTLIGGAAGLGAGALVGSAVGSPGAGAAIGGLGGAVAGYGIGNYMQNQQYRAYHNGYY